MAQNRPGKFYVDWWNIQKSTIYSVAGILLIAAALIGGLWWASRSNWFVAAPELDAPKDAARIVSFEGEVRIVRAQTRETILVTKPTYVSAGDTIQTQSDGRAILQMIDGSKYSVRPNSTIVVRDTTTLFGGKNVRVRLNDGQLNVRTDDEPADTKNIVELAETENQLGSNTDASFNTNGTNGGEIRISRGGVETTMNGEKTTIGENEYVSVNGNKLSTREALLAPPRLVSPANGSQMVDSTGSGVSVTFNWQDAEAGNAASFYIQVAKNPNMSSDSILVDRGSLQTREFRLAGLTPGTYYWRLKSTGRSGQTTGWNEPWKFSIVRPGASVQIDVSDWRVEPVGGNVYLISGRTQAGMAVRAAGRQTFAGPDGAFKLQISAPGTEANVDVGDERGNRSGFVISLQNGALIRRY